MASQSGYTLTQAQKDQMVNDANAKDLRAGWGPYVINGVPISKKTNGCCVQNPCLCRSDVIFYNGQAYDQKPFIKARLITRPGNVMYMEGKLTPPFNPGNSPCIYGPYRNRDKKPITMGFKDNQFGKGLSHCCTTSIYGDNIPPFVNIRSNQLAYTEAGLPFGPTIGYFRFKPDEVCDKPPVSRITDCCNCEPGRYNPAEYNMDECPVSTRCC
ncbi:hypothetical protein EGW08_000033 [Elysia chlorotica]|uniref:Uncharacterized protein n=1 Tax=Elysia chlorotica TaxID=188477 RepID=A0A433UE20_ELYCH|nr:hypothetical protein EGW08_000033 [Elysia chlorotica]